MRTLRVFYRLADNEIVWYHETRSPEGIPAVCPTTVEGDLDAMPDNKPDGKTPLGGIPADYSCIEVEDIEMIEAYFKSDANRAVDDKLIVGEPRVIPVELPPEPVRDAFAEIDELRTKLKEKGIL